MRFINDFHTEDLDDEEESNGSANSSDQESCSANDNIESEGMNL